MAVRHISLSGRLNWSPRPRTSSGASATSGRPPDREKRPITGTRPGRKTTAFEKRAPVPLLSKNPDTPTPLA